MNQSEVTGGATIFYTYNMYQTNCFNLTLIVKVHKYVPNDYYETSIPIFNSRYFEHFIHIYLS